MAEQGTSYEQELAGYLQERIRPGLNRGSIPLLARSIAKEIASREQSNGTSQDPEADDESTAEAEPDVEAESDVESEYDDEDAAEAEPDVESESESDDEDAAEAEQSTDGEEWNVFEADMHELQAELGEDWIVQFSVQGDDAWLAAEKSDGSQHVEAQTADALVEVVELLNESGGRTT